MPHYSDIPHSNPNTDRAFDTLLAALEELAPGIRANLKFVLESCLPGSPNQFTPGTREDEIRKERGIDAVLDLPPEELGGFQTISKHAPQIIDALSGDLDDRKFTLFPNARRLGIQYGEGRWCDLTVHACSDPKNSRGQDLFSVSLRDHDESADTEDMIMEMSGARYVHPSRAGSAQPSFADALKSEKEFLCELGAFASAIGDFREQIQYLRSGDSSVTARFRL